MKPIPSGFAPGRILIIQLRQIGDVLLTTPAVRALRRAYPEARIDYLAEPLPSKVLEDNPNIDRIIIRDPKEGGLEPVRTIAKIRANRYDLVVDFLANPRTALISFLSGAKITLSYAGARRSFLYSHPVAPEGVFSAAQKASLLRVLGIEPDDMDLDMPVPDRAFEKIDQWLADTGAGKSSRPLVCLEPFQKHEVLTYPSKSWIRVCDLMVEKLGATVIVCWGPGKEDDARAIAEGGRNKLCLAPATDLHELAALYRRADLWVGVDCGPRHIATAQKLPTFAVLGPSDDAWTPLGERHLSVYRSDLPCLPCDKRHCPEGHHKCMKEFAAEDVFARLEKFWARLGEGQQS